MSKSEIHKQVIFEITQFYGDSESIENIKEHWAKELESAEVEITDHMNWITYRFQMDHEIANRLHTMFKVLFGADQNIGGGNELQIEIRELERDMAQQDYDYIVDQIPYDDEDE